MVLVKMKLLQYIGFILAILVGWCSFQSGRPSSYRKIHQEKLKTVIARRWDMEKLWIYNKEALIGYPSPCTYKGHLSKKLACSSKNWRKFYWFYETLLYSNLVLSCRHQVRETMSVTKTITLDWFEFVSCVLCPTQAEDVFPFLWSPLLPTWHEHPPCWIISLCIRSTLLFCI